MIQRFFPGAWAGNDRDGRPIYVLRIGDIDVRGLMKALQEEAWIRHVIIFSFDSFDLEQDHFFLSDLDFVSG